ncbi:MAG: hypothetical protein KGS61_10410 [Verrucomicrobia bacterium]|nr:hypothetical protein [Verrucomicrobiota bacterium]
MNDLLQPTSRRTLLQRGVLLVAGALGLKLAEKDARGDPAAMPGPETTVPGGTILRFYTRQLHGHVHGQSPGRLPVSSGRLEHHAPLLAQPDGPAIGRFSAICFHPDAAARAERDSTAHVALQTLEISGDSLFGIGPGLLGTTSPTTHAILGGTGRFAGARGSYVIRESARAGQTRIEFTIQLMS